MSTEAFRGTYHQKVDSKARVSIPHRMRRKLDLESLVSPDDPKTRIVMVYGGSGRNYVECYSVAGAEALAADIEMMPMGSEDRQLAERDLFMMSVTVEIDDDGRFVLPPPVRKKMGFRPDDLEKGGMASFAGVSNRIKLYRYEVLEAELEALENAEQEDDYVDPLARVSKYKTGR